MCALVEDAMVFKKDINPFILKDETCDSYGLLALMNSILISYLYVNSSTIATKDDFRQTTLAELRALPIPSSEALLPLANFAKQLERLYSEAEQCKTEPERRSIKRQIDSIEDKIDNLVFEIYSVSSKEAEKIRK